MSDFLKNYPALTYATDMAEICKPLNKLSISYFAHVNITDDHKFSALGCCPEFVRHYLANHYYNADIHLAKKNLGDMVVWDSIERSGESEKMHREAAQFGVKHTFTIIEKTAQGSDYYHFATHLDDTAINQIYLANLDLLQKFIMHFKDNVAQHKGLKRFKEFTFAISANNAQYAIKQSLPPIDVTGFNDALKLKHIYYDDRHYLTLREFECLHWLSHGRTIEQIALILAITPRTVKAHIKNIKTKLECDNYFQLGVIYQQLNGHHLLTPIPNSEEL